jgi:hypothetical protein
VLKPVRPAALILLGLGLGQTFTPTDSPFCSLLMISMA